MYVYSPDAMRQARQDAGVRRTHAARAADRSEGSISAYERDAEPPLTILLRLTNLYGIDLYDVLVEVDDAG